MIEERTRVWITGARGLIGRHLIASAPKFGPQFEVVPISHAELDLTDFAGVEKKFRAERPQWVIHGAAISRAGDCAADPAGARRVNVDATAHLAALAADSGFLFFSSDQVFDGVKGHYVESDATNPLQFYGETKAAAEEIVLRNPRHLVIRAGPNSGGATMGNRSFDEEIAAAWRSGGTVKLFKDEFRCPIPAAATARAVWELVAAGAGGLFHLCGSERLSRVEMGKAVARHHPDLTTRIEVTSRLDYHGPARPADVSMNCAKVQRLLSVPLPAFSKVEEL